MQGGPDMATSTAEEARAAAPASQAPPPQARLTLAVVPGNDYSLELVQGLGENPRREFTNVRWVL